ncbi:MAG: AAA family ATPase [Desulfovibrio sp.]|nr:AAA family ATPase [Desulfovibrio sp.]
MTHATMCDPKRLPLGRSGFSDIRQNHMIYVDKTDFVAKLADLRQPIFFSRPRRFGKSLLVNTLHSLFAHGLNDFHGLALEKIWNDTTYHVAHFDFSRFTGKNASDFKYALSYKILQELATSDTSSQFHEQHFQYPDLILDKLLASATSNAFVLLIDEYDAPITHRLDKPHELDDIIAILNDFYATIKQYSDKFRFIFITGITRISHISLFSTFNNLLDLSLSKEFNTILGFTKNDLQKYFKIYSKNAATYLQMTYEEVDSRLEQYYDGFQFSLETEETVYNPWSILNFYAHPSDGFYNYWFASGGFSTLLMQYLKVNKSFNLLNYHDREIFIEKYKIFDRYDIANIPSNILLLQTGYFTLRKETESIVRLVFPNTEVEDSMLRVFLTANNLEPSINSYHKLQNLEKFIDDKNLQEIVNSFNAILNDCVSNNANIFEDERSIRDIIYAAIPQNISLQKIKERETAKGRSDLELVTRKTNMVIEFKRIKQNRDARASLSEAIRQIESKRYGIKPFNHRSLYRVAMVVSTQDKLILQEFCQEVF